MIGPLFWKLLAGACLLWYSTITVYVAIRGAADIRHMLRNLAAGANGRGRSAGQTDSGKPDAGE